MSEPAIKEYSILRLSKDNIIDLAKLHSEVYSGIINENFFVKKYNTSYTGVENIGFLAYNKCNQPVAYYGVIPCFIQFENTIILAAQSADTMTHPKHRFKGMFVELSNMTFELCKESGIRLIFGFPNQNSYHGAVTKLGWKETEVMDCFTIAINPLSLSSITTKMKLERLYKIYMNFILKKRLTIEKGVSNSVVADGFASVHRSEEYLLYKTYSQTKVIRIGEAKLWISIKHNLVIGDMENVTEDNFNAVVSKLKNITRKLGLNQLLFHCCKNTSLHKIFSASYKPSKSFPVLFQDFGSPVPLEKIKFTLADIDIF